MVSVAEASAIIQNNLWKPKSENVALIQSIGRTLAQDVLADRDFPPFNRVTMDGIAIDFNSYSKTNKKFKIQGVQAAGSPQLNLDKTTNCFEVMTGAIVPKGCDTIIRYEDIKIEDGEAEIVIDNLKSGDNIHVKGSDAQEASIILKNGSQISSAEIPLLASVGCSSVAVKSLPRTAIISTGNELVEIDHKPELHQIRRSNVYALASALKKYSIISNLFHLPDDEEILKSELKTILDNHDLVILSGGVSKGKFDFIPSILEVNGIQKHFHQIKQRPGKPMWFGTGNDKVVFALPGNPVSTYLCYYKYIEPWLVNSFGRSYSAQKVRLTNDFTFDPAITYFLQVKIKNEEGILEAAPIPGGGSGDFINLVDVDGFLELPAEKSQFIKGEVYPYFSFR